MEPNTSLQNIDTALEHLPEEIRSFLFDGEFDVVFEPYKDKYTDQEKFLGIKNKTLQYVLGIIAINDLKISIEQNTEDVQLADTLKRDIQEKIIDEAFLILETHKEMRGDKPSQEIVASENTTMKRFAQSFTTPTTLAPTKRVYTEPAASPSTTTQPTTGNKPLSEAIPVPPVNVDPYREAPDTR